MCEAILLLIGCIELVFLAAFCYQLGSQTLPLKVQDLGVDVMFSLSDLPTTSSELQLVILTIFISSKEFSRRNLRAMPINIENTMTEAKFRILFYFT